MSRSATPLQLLSQKGALNFRAGSGDQGYRVLSLGIGAVGGMLWSWKFYRDFVPNPEIMTPMWNEPSPLELIQCRLDAPGRYFHIFGIELKPCELDQ